MDFQSSKLYGYGKLRLGIKLKCSSESFAFPGDVLIFCGFLRSYRNHASKGVKSIGNDIESPHGENEVRVKSQLGHFQLVVVTP